MANPVLIFIHGANAGKRVSVDGSEATMGRSRQNDVILQDPMVSRVHAILMRKGGVTLLEDLGSHNGTYVNDERIHGVRQLHHGDRVGLGSTRIIFEDPTLVADEPTQVTDRAGFMSQTFTQRQIQVLRLIARGHSNKEIGERLYVSERTVKAYLSSIFEKLQVQKRAAAVAEALRLGLIDPPREGESEV